MSITITDNEDTTKKEPIVEEVKEAFKRAHRLALKRITAEENRLPRDRFGPPR